MQCTMQSILQWAPQRTLWCTLQRTLWWVRSVTPCGAPRTVAPIVAGPAPSGTAPSASVKAKMQKTSPAVIQACNRME
jgi:hypothetical protein